MQLIARKSNPMKLYYKTHKANTHSRTCGGQSRDLSTVSHASNALPRKLFRERPRGGRADGDGRARTSTSRGGHMNVSYLGNPTYMCYETCYTTLLPVLLVCTVYCDGYFGVILGTPVVPVIFVVPAVPVPVITVSAVVCHFPATVALVHRISRPVYICRHMQH